MQEDILKSGLISKIVFTYIDGVGVKKKEIVTLSYMDNKYCYFKSLNTFNFNKPKWRAKADITAYTSEGLFETKVIIRDSSYSQQEILFEVDIPKAWTFKQMRAGTRKSVDLPININFADDISIDSNIKELSIGGFSIISNHNMTNAQKGFPANCCITFSGENKILTNNQLNTNIKFVRQKAITDVYELDGYYMISFKFTALTAEQKNALKTFLMNI